MGGQPDIHHELNTADRNQYWAIDAKDAHSLCVEVGFSTICCVSEPPSVSAERPLTMQNIIGRERSKAE